MLTCRAFLNASILLCSLCLHWETHCSLVAFAVLADSHSRRLTVRRKLEDGRYRRRWRWSHATTAAGAGAVDSGTRPAGMQTEYQLEPATSAGIILPETGQFLLLHSLQLWYQLQCCRRTRARAPLFFLYILLQFCGNSSPGTTSFLGKRTVTSERSG